MSQHDDFDRSLARWLDAESRPAATVDVLDRAMRASRGRRPRPRLFAALGSDWVGDSVGPTSGGATLGRTGSRPTMALLLVLLVLALVAGAVLVGSRLLQPAPVQPAADDLGIFAPVAGRIVYGDERGYWAMDLATPADPATRVLLTSEPGTPLAWSSDGTQLLIMRGRSPEASLFVLHADGSETKVTERPMEIKGATILRDGPRVVFEGAEALYAVDVDGGPAEVLVEAQGGIGEKLAFSPDSARIAYIVGSGDHSNSVWVMDVDGSDAHQILANETILGAGHVRGLAWSPMGDRIALALEGTIYTFAPDGSGFTRVINDGDIGCDGADDCADHISSFAESPYWSPDGSQIAFSTGCVDGTGRRGGRCRLAIANADGSNVRTFAYPSGPWHPGVPAIERTSTE